MSFEVYLAVVMLLTVCSGAVGAWMYRRGRGGDMGEWVISSFGGVVVAVFWPIAIPMAALLAAGWLVVLLVKRKKK